MIPITSEEYPSSGCSSTTHGICGQEPFARQRRQPPDLRCRWRAGSRSCVRAAACPSLVVALRGRTRGAPGRNLVRSQHPEVPPVVVGVDAELVADPSLPLRQHGVVRREPADVAPAARSGPGRDSGPAVEPWTLPGRLRQDAAQVCRFGPLARR